MSAHLDSGGVHVVGILQLSRRGDMPIETHAEAELRLVEVWIEGKLFRRCIIDTIETGRAILRLTPEQAAEWGGYLTAAAKVAGVKSMTALLESGGGLALSRQPDAAAAAAASPVPLPTSPASRGDVP